MSAISSRTLAWAAVALSTASFLVSVSGVTPADAARAVARALNADKVGGIGASRTPKAGKLVPLGSDARFPAAVLPPTARGPRGSVGPKGDQGLIGAAGPPGVAVVRVARGPAREMPKQANVPVDVARLDNVPAGNWLLTFTATLADLDGAVVTSAQCDFVIAGVQVQGGSVGVGGAPSATHVIVAAGTATTSQAAPFDVVLRCRQNHDLTASTFTLVVDVPRLVAIRADSLETTG
jgi:hypothetical protein